MTYAGVYQACRIRAASSEEVLNVAARKTISSDLATDLELRRMFAVGWEIGAKQEKRKPNRKAARAAWEQFSASVARASGDPDASSRHEAAD